MNQIAVRDPRKNNHLSGIVDRFKHEIAGQKSYLLPELFHREAEVLEASVARYGKICEGLPDAEESWSTLRETMSEDSAVAPYLSAAVGDPRHAVNLARADVEYWKCLRHSGWKTAAQRRSARLWKIVRIAMLPLSVVLLTAILGNWIASSIQEKAFEEQKFFEARFQRLREGQERSVTLVARLRSLEDMMAGWEVFGGGVNPRQRLEEYREEIEQVRALGLDDEGGGPISALAHTAQQELESYISCLEAKLGQQRSSASTASCSEEFELKNFEALSLSFVKEISALAK